MSRIKASHYKNRFKHYSVEMSRLHNMSPEEALKRLLYTTSPKVENLLDGDGALHARALVGLAVVAVGAGGVELVRDLFAGAVEVIFVRDRIRVDARGDVVLVENNVVGERLVVDKLHGLALGDGDLVGLQRGERRRGEVRRRSQSIFGCWFLDY